MDEQERQQAIDASRKLGSLGGNTTKTKYGPDHFKRISKLGNEVLRRKREEKDLQNTK